MEDRFKSFIAPKTIAIVGASERLQHNAGRVMVNLEKSNYSGKIYLVNPKYESISGMPCYPTILEIDEPIDLVCIITPADETPKILRDCVTKKVKSVMILSSGFSENGQVGIEKEKELKEIIQGEDITVYGPNSPGIYDYINQWGISFSPRFEPKKFKRGSVGLISHGGGLGRAILDANEKGVGFTYWLSPGNEMDINVNDCLEFLLEEPNTQSIILVVESIGEEERFFRLLHKAFQKQKPIIFLPIGVSEVSRNAVKHHLGRNNEYAIPWDIVNHPGLIKVDSIYEAVAVSWLFDAYGKSKGERTAIFSWAGATSIYLADICSKYGVQLPPLSEHLKERITEIVGIEKHFMNPLDLTTAIYDDSSKLFKSLNALSTSGEFDNIIVAYPFQVDYQDEILSVHIKDFMDKGQQLYLPIFMSQGNQIENAIESIKDTKKPSFFQEHIAIKALAAYLSFKKPETKGG